MKKWTLFFSFILPVLQVSTLSYQAVARNWENRDSKYCAMLKDGKLMVLKENEAVTADITLKDGSILTLDGTILRKDGTRVILQNGECVDEHGKVLPKDKKDKNPEMKYEYPKPDRNE
jgi:hypothetical protein